MNSTPSKDRKSLSLLRSGILVSICTFLSRILGLVRDAALAYVLGASGSADAFYVAFKIPNFFRRLFAEGAFAQAFVPVVSDYRIKEG
jgi:putative peptidoglycan lipid II flippase